MGQRISRRRLDELVRAHLPSLLRFAIRLTGSLHDGEDVTQETLLRVSRSWKKLQDEDSFKPWAFQILVNAVRDRHRRQEREVASRVAGQGEHGQESLKDLVVEAASGSPTAEEIYELVSLREEIEEKLQRLPTRQREVLALLAFEPYSPQDVAEMLQIEVSNVYSTLRVARKKLQELLADGDQ